MPFGDLSKYKVVFKDRVLRALSIMECRFPANQWPSEENPAVKPEHITVLIINSDGVLEAFTGKADEFQFIPVLN